MKSIGNNGLEKEVYRFGGFVLDAERRELRFRDREIRLQPRVYELLLHLLRNSERAVDKDELQDAVWPGMIVTETALTRAIMKARKAVGDDANRQVVIKTLHGHGYRFVAPLEIPAGGTGPVEDAAGPPAQEERPEVPASSAPLDAGEPSTGRSRPRWLLLGAVLILAAALGLWRLLIPVAAAPEEMRVAVLPVSNATGNPELDWTGLGLMSYARNLLAMDEDIPVVPDGSIVSLVDGFGWNGDLADPQNQDLLDRLGQAYGASHMLAMTLQREGGRLRMSFGLLQPDGRLREGTMVGEDGTVLVRGVVQSLYGLLLRRSRIGPEVELVSSDPFNNEAFGRGMSLRLEGRCAEAVPFFRLIVEQEPALVAPRHELAACLRILGEWQEAEQLLTGLVDELQALGPSRPLAQSSMVLGVLYNRTGRLDEAERALGRALEVARVLDDRNLAGRILQNLSIVAEDRSDWAGATELLDRAVAEYRRAGLEVLPGQVWAAHGNLKLDQGDLVEAEGYFRRGLEAFRAVGDRRNEAMMLNNTGLVRRLQGRLDEAEQYHLQSLEIREAIGDRVGVGRIQGMLAVVYVQRGQLAQARTAALQAVQIARETRDRLFEGTSLAELGEAERALGNAQEATRRYREARAVFEGIQDRMRVLQCDVKLAQLDLDAGRADAAGEAAGAVLAAAREANLLQPEIEAMELLGDAAYAGGDPERAEQHFTAALARVRESSWAGAENRILAKLAGVLMDRDDLVAAEPLIGALSRQEANADSLRVQARFAWLGGDAAAAARQMAQARERAGEGWDEESEREYQRYLAAQ